MRQMQFLESKHKTPRCFSETFFKKKKNNPSTSKQPFHFKVSAKKVLWKLFLCIKLWSEYQTSKSSHNNFSFLGYYEWSLTPISPCYICHPGTEILEVQKLVQRKDLEQVQFLYSHTKKKTELLVGLDFCCF